MEEKHPVTAKRKAPEGFNPLQGSRQILLTFRLADSGDPLVYDGILFRDLAIHMVMTEKPVTVIRFLFHFFFHRCSPFLAVGQKGRECRKHRAFLETRLRFF